jgi:hypothetical protein
LLAGQYGQQQGTCIIVDAITFFSVGYIKYGMLYNACIISEVFYMRKFISGKSAGLSFRLFDATFNFAIIILF